MTTASNLLGQLDGENENSEKSSDDSSKPRIYRSGFSLLRIKKSAFGLSSSGGSVSKNHPSPIRKKSSTLKRSLKSAPKLSATSSLFRLSAERVRSTLRKKKTSVQGDEINWSQYSFRKITDEEEQGHVVPIPEGSNRAYLDEESQLFDVHSEVGEEDREEVREEAESRLVPDLRALCFNSNVEVVKEIKDSGDFDIKTPIREDLPTSFRLRKDEL